MRDPQVFVSGIIVTETRRNNLEIKSIYNRVVSVNMLHHPDYLYETIFQYFMY